MAVTESKPPTRPWWVKLLRLAGIVAVVYVGTMIVLLFLENSLVFHPTKADDWQAAGSLRAEDVELRSGDGTPIHAWWCPRQGSEGVLLYCHGNAGNLSWRKDRISEWQEEMHWDVLIFDYPGFGKSGGKPSEAGCYASADAAYDWLVGAKKVPPQRLIIYGSSLGSGVAVDLASRRDHRALVLARAFTSVPDMAQKIFPWLPARWLVRNKFDSLAKIGRCPRPVFIAHGDRDGLAPFSFGQRLFAAASEPKEFLVMRECDHNDPFSSDFFPFLRKFLAKSASSKKEPVSSISKN